MDNSPPLFILYGGQLLNVRDIKRAAIESGELWVEFRSGGYTILEGENITLEGLANTINRL